MAEQAPTEQHRASCRLHGIALGDDGRCAICRRKNEDVPEEPASPWRMLAFFMVLGAIALGGYLVTRTSATRPEPRADELQKPWEAASEEPEEPTAQPPPPEGPTVVDERKKIREELEEREELIEIEMKNVPIVMYGTKSSPCKECERARAWFEANGYRFEERDVEADGRYMRIRDRLNPNKTVPTLVIGATTVVEFDEKNVEKVIRVEAEARL